MRDYYEILCVHPTASAAAIGKNYRIQIKKNHPDINKAFDARAKTILINQAYEVLSDPVKREKYDQEYFYSMAGENFKPNQRKVRFRPFLWWITMLLFVFADLFHQLSIKEAAPVSPILFVLFLLYTAIRDNQRTIAFRVGWALGIYILYLVLQGLATMVVWKIGVRAPLALAFIVVSQCPALWFVMRRSSLFTLKE